MKILSTRILGILLFVLLIQSKAIGQNEEKKDEKQVTLKGYVYDEKKQPLPGVTIRLKGTTYGTSTDKDGKYKLELPKVKDPVLIFSFIGMETIERKYMGEDTINVILKDQLTELETVIVHTGYQNVDVRKTTSSIQSIKAEDIVLPGLQSIDQMLEGYIPGMVFMSNSGQVGATPRLRIRGTSTVLGSQEPLWVVDGIVQEDPVNIDPEQINDLDFVNLLGNAISGLNPEDIQQIDVLKDAAATALYGARAANGVIVITTKQGKVGPPSLSYSLSGTFRRRPYYSDDAVNMMNSRERVALSRELIEKEVAYSSHTSAWLGYEKAIRDYWQGYISYDELREQEDYYASINTDWFDILTRNSFSQKHTLSLSGGSSQLRYYASVGFADDKGNIKGEKNKNYTANLNLTGNYDNITIRFGVSASSAEKEYTPSSVDVMGYAYNTSRALPAYNEDGSLWYYEKSGNHEGGGERWRNYNIINEINHSLNEINASRLNIRTSIDYRITDYLKASATASYSVNKTTDETWFGENSYYVKIKGDPEDGTQKWNTCPYGGELVYSNTDNTSYLFRAQLDFNKFMDKNEKHLITASLGGEVSSNKYKGLNKTFRGYLKDRGKKMSEVDLEKYPNYADWLNTEAALGVWTDKLTNIASAYATLSYTYDGVYMFNVNARIDGSNRFGTRSNEKMNPIWSISARWDIKDDILKPVDWIQTLALKGSFGYQGNMLDSESAQTVIEKGGINGDFESYEATISKYPNVDLKWEKTASYNAELDFSLFKGGKVQGTVSYFYKKTKDAFMTKNISAINGVNSWTVNQGEIENKGFEVNLRFKVIDTHGHNPNGFRWSINPNLGQIINNLTQVSSTNNEAYEVTYSDFLNGSAKIKGKSLNSFYSYRFLGLSSADGMPIFYGSKQQQFDGQKTIDLKEKYMNTADKTEVYKDVMVYSGCRVPKIQAGIQNSISWRRFTMSLNLTYSIGAKIRLLKMYPNMTGSISTSAPKITENVRKEFVNRWQRPGDEINTTIPGIVYSASSDIDYTYRLWCNESTYLNQSKQNISFASNIWQMYDNSDLRTVSGDYLKIQSLSVRYNFSDEFCKSLHIKSAYVGFSGTNLHTFCSSKLKGQDPTTQNGTAPTINMSLRPTYSFNLNISF